MTSPATVARAQRSVLAWFDANARAFPWREHRDPYRTLVAEVMLQQTQTARVAPIYAAFIERFPTVQHLAQAPTGAVIGAWKGLGYNRRAVALQRAAQIVVERFDGEVPGDVERLRALPGIGAYTASAVACFAYDAQIPVVDVNVRRVLARVALGDGAEAGSARALDRLAEQWLPAGQAYRWNQALMDIGATMCRARVARCDPCPLRATCAFASAGSHERRLRPSTRKQRPFEGSRRQARGAVVDALRLAGRRGLTLGRLAGAVDSVAGSRDPGALADVLAGLEADGLVELSAAAKQGRARGLVRLPG